MSFIRVTLSFLIFYFLFIYFFFFINFILFLHKGISKRSMGDFLTGQYSLFLLILVQIHGKITFDNVPFRDGLILNLAFYRNPDKIV